MRAIEPFIVYAAVGLVVGFATGRSILVLLVPAAVIAFTGLSDTVLPNDIHWWLAIVAGATAAGGTAVGVGARRMLTGPRR